jgi:ribonuclease D
MNRPAKFEPESLLELEGRARTRRFCLLETSIPNYNPDVIDDDKKLASLAEAVRTAAWLAMDTEADSLHAYPEKVCLIQISLPGADELIDPLSKMDLEPLFRALASHELIMHGSDYDLRLLRKHHSFVPSAIFDTMLASRLLGATQFGLTNLLSQYLGVTLDKGPQKADWARRPLTERMENYARNDTHHLKPLADRLRADLAAKGRLEWQKESCARLIRDCAEIVPPNLDLMWRIKGSHKLNGTGLAVLREIWHWREFEAIDANKPPYFIMPHEKLVELSAAAAMGRPLDPLISRRFSSHRRSGLEAALRQGLALPAAKRPEPIRQTFRRISDATKRRMAELQKKRDARATELGIDPTLIASRAVLLDLAEDWARHQAELMAWQRELLK